jgi:GNAT superfamily N-acetyltransferase
MILDRPPDRPADTSVVEDAGEDEMLELMRRWYEHDEPTPTEVEQLVEFGRREARALGDRLLGVRSGDGRLVAITKLRSDGSTAQVEDVYTVPEARGRGFARALVSRAVELARDREHEMTFIAADDEDWPKSLYGRLGFRSVGHLWHFHRD